MAERKGQYYKEQLFTTAITKGSYEGVTLAMWDVCDLCSADDCPIHDKCHYIKDENKKCQVQTKYISQVFNTLVQQNREYLSDPMMTRMGFELIPLFSHLIKFKIEEAGMRKRVYFDDKGNMKINPVYREIRDIIRTIEMTYRNILGDFKPQEKEEKTVHGMGDESYMEALVNIEPVKKKPMKTKGKINRRRTK